MRQWCQQFGAEYARTLKQRQGRLGDTWHLDKLFVTIRGQRQYLWRAVDQDGDAIDILVQPRRDQCAAERFFHRLLKGQGSKPWRLVTNKLRSYGVAHRTIMPSVIHDTERYANNRAEVSHQPIDNASDRCEGLNPPRKRKHSCPSTESSIISSESDGTCSVSQPPDTTSPLLPYLA